LILRALGILLGLAAGWSVPVGPQTRAPVERTVYVTATDQNGVYIANLEAADFSVKEGNAERPVLRVAPASARLKICLAIDEGLSPDAIVREAAARFIQQLQGSADIALHMVGPANTKLVDYTTDASLLIKLIAGLPSRAQGAGNLVESLFELAKTQRNVEGRRVLVVLATEVPQRRTVTAKGVIDQLRDTGAVLFAVTLSGPAGTAEPMTPDMAHLETTEEAERDRVLNDGTRQSGGFRVTALRVESFSAALDRIRGELLHQYELTYVLPAGAKSDGRVSITARKSGVTVRGPRVVRIR